MPIKRGEALQPLSRQHHNGLLFCLLLKKGVAKQASLAVMQEFIQWFWYKDLHHHFELEEMHLLPLQQHYHRLQQPLNRMMEDHYALKSIVNEIGLNAGYEVITELYTQLEAHIRFEERELFELIESIASTNEIAIIGKALHVEREANCMNYPTRFWE